VKRSCNIERGLSFDCDQITLASVFSLYGNELEKVQTEPKILTHEQGKFCAVEIS
jgi:hypothetical protein